MLKLAQSHVTVINQIVYARQSRLYYNLCVLLNTWIGGVWLARLYYNLCVILNTWIGGVWLARLYYNPVCLTFRWFIPFIGHMGICTSAGVIRDFAGPYYVSVSSVVYE